jgi:MFS family permease
MLEQKRRRCAATGRRHRFFALMSASREASVDRRLSPLRHRRFRLLFFGQATSNIGDGMVGVALAFAVLHTGSPADLGLVYGCRVIPIVCFTLFGGVLADRISRRAVVLAADAGRCALQALLAVLVLTGEAQLWQLVAIPALTAVGTAFFLPSISGLVVDTVPLGEVQQANSLRSMADSAGYVVGPVLAGAIVAASSPGWALLADAATYGVSALSLVWLHVPRRPAERRKGILNDLKEGREEFLARPWLVAAAVHAAGMNLFVLATFYVAGAVVAKHALGGAGAWSVIVAGYGAGLVVGGLVALRVRLRHQFATALSGGALFAPVLAALALHAPVPVIALLALVAGAQGTFSTVIWETTLQRAVPDHALSRVIAWDWVAALACQPLGYALAGVLSAGSSIGPSATLWAAAGAAVVVSVPLPAIGSVRRVDL